jgi:excisionase family DNA binding protein
MSDMLTVEQVMDAARIRKRDTVYRWIKNGKLKAARIGRNWLVRRDDLELALRPVEAEASAKVSGRRGRRPSVLPSSVQRSQVQGSPYGRVGR